MNRFRTAAAAALLTCAVALAGAGTASAQTTQDGLVNVNLEDITVLLPVALAANVCDVNVGLLARQERQGGATCTATAESLATPGNGGAGGRTDQDGLVNVNVSGVDVLVPVALAANLCDINVGVLARQEREGGAACTATADSIASRGSGQGGRTEQDGLVNVNVSDVVVLVPIGIAANLCDINLGVLARQEREGGATCTATAESLASPGAGSASRTDQDGLVNVNVSGVDVLAPIALAANLCDLNVGVLARQERDGGATCTATAESIATPGNGGNGGSTTRQDGLVNVNIADVQVLLPIALAANICDVNVGVLARQERRGGATCRATAESIASPGTGQRARRS
jgi:hypothetical protein